MSSTDDAYLSLLPVALFGSLLFLRRKFPKASRSSETIVLAVATLLFFSLCTIFGGPVR